MTAQLAIYGVRHDGHIARVARHLAELGGEVVIIDPESDRSCTLGFSNLGSTSEIIGVHPVTNEPIKLSDHYAYWLRNKKKFTHFEDKEQQQSQFTISEMTAAILGDMKAHKRPSFNNYASIKYHESKPYQLRLASEIGLLIPNTIISNLHSDIVKFAESLPDPRLAMKAVENVYIAPPISDPSDSVVLYTQLVTVQDLREADPSEFNGPPFILQEYVDKIFEVRLVMFDGEALAYRIDSQISSKGQIDWRLDEDAPVEIIEIPEDINKLCREYLSQSELNYGAFDFCVDKAGRWIFLECNAEGQWAWLEGEGQEISRMFARRFLALISA